MVRSQPSTPEISLILCKASGRSSLRKWYGVELLTLARLDEDGYETAADKLAARMRLASPRVTAL